VSHAADRLFYGALLLFGVSLGLSKSASNVLLGLLGLTTVVGALQNADFRAAFVRNRKQPLTAALISLYLVALFGVLFTENYAEGLNVANKFLGLLAIYYFVSFFLQSEPREEVRSKRAEHLLMAFLAGLGLLNALGLLIFIGAIGSAGFTLPLVPLNLHHIWYSNINALGLYTVMALLLFSPRAAATRAKVYLSLFLLLSVACILLSTSRTAWFSMALTLAALTFVVIRRVKVIVCVAAVSALAAAGAYYFLPVVHERVQLAAAEIALFSAGEAYTSIGSRFLLWKSALRMFLSHPLLGIGTGNYVRALTADIESGLLPDFLREFNQPHNIYLFALATNGIFGFAALLAVFYRSLRFALPRLRAENTEKLFPFLAMATAVHFMIAGFMDSFFNIQILRFSFAFLMGVCVRGSLNRLAAPDLGAAPRRAPNDHRTVANQL